MKLGVLNSDAIKVHIGELKAGRDVLVWGALMSDVNEFIKLDQHWPEEDMVGKLSPATGYQSTTLTTKPPASRD